MTVPVAFVLWVQLMKVCGPAELGKMNCTWEETWLWIKSGGDWRLWTFVGLLSLGIFGAFLGPEDAKEGPDQRN